ncbi:hypothetical protein ABZ901_30660 [Actinacidiphila alni]|uniref:hypothetical protein n=1 Tax=Actinacidiphila alni TaxID=380248 RepID=UPI0033C89F0F
MITEPEMVDSSDDGDDDRPGGVEAVEAIEQGPLPPGGAAGRPGGAWWHRSWAWALAGVLVTSAVWAGVLRSTHDDDSGTPDLHGYHLAESPCTGQNLQPLVDRLSATTVSSDNGPVITGSTLDHVSCDLTGDTSSGDGWSTSYTISVTVDLHKKTDPSPEFEDAVKVAVSAPGGTLFGGNVYVPSTDQHTEPLSGLGDRAYLTTGTFSQSVNVQHGGAVFSLSISADNAWNGEGAPPTKADGAAERPLVADTRAYAAELPRTVRHLMSVLAKP